VEVAGEGATVLSMDLQCNTGLRITEAGAGATVLSVNVNSGFAGISILGDFATVFGCAVSYIQVLWEILTESHFLN
jgi:hypothetical protein